MKILQVLIESSLVPQQAVGLLVKQGLLDQAEADRFGRAPLPVDNEGLRELAERVEEALADAPEAETFDDITRGADVLVRGQFDAHESLAGKVCGQVLYLRLPPDVDEDSLFLLLPEEIEIVAWGGSTVGVQYRSPEVVQHRGQRWLRAEL